MRNIARSFIFICILSIVTVAITDDRDTPWLLSWPFFSKAPVPHKIIGGYGDWCVKEEGLHPGLDFAASHGDSVLLPTDSIRITRGCYFNQYSGYALAIGYESASTEGWYLGHLKVDNYTIPPFTTGSVVMDHQALAPCSLYDGQGPLHMHLQWTDIPLPAVPPGLHNPFDYFENSLTGYDAIQFNRVRWEDFLSPATNRGIWFTADNHETYTQLGWVTDQDMFQNIIHGAVDIAVAPFSAFQGLLDEDSSGVYSVAYEILRQDPISLQYNSAAPDTGNYGQRWLMQMRDELPAGDSPEYRSIFPDGLTLSGVSVDPDWYYNMNAYIVTNSGALDPASWTTGWDNVWTAYNVINDWEDGICQGAWDTFLANPGITGDPTQNSEAFFPDGKYAVKVTAVSHASRDTVSMRLPMDDLSLPVPSVEGVVVDNFLPHIERVAVYVWNPSASTCYLIYEGYWEDIVTDRARERESEHLEPGCCLDEGIGQDPVDLLLEEIARVENQQLLNDSDTTRELTDETYRYLPGIGQSVSRQLLVLQVFYSEPIMIKSFIQPNNLGQLHLRGTIGNLTTWLSYNYGKFVRQPGSFQLPLASDNTAGIGLESDSTLFDSSYVVHYIFEGALPREYIGNIQLYFGNPGQPVGGGPLDLAGNTLDSYPGTVPESRNDYGPFSYNGFEAGPDTNHSWGVPDWDHHVSTDIVYGTVGIENELVATVDLNSIGLEDAWFIGDCDYWCGFWMYREIPGEYGFNIYVVKPDGSYIDHSFKTPFPVYEQGQGYEPWWYGQVSPSYYPTLSPPDGRYFWMVGGTLDWINDWSTMFAYCVDSKTGAAEPTEVCSGWIVYFGSSLFSNLQIEEHMGCSGKWAAAGSNAEVLNIDSTGIAQIEYSYFETSANTSGVTGIDTLPPPGGSDDNLFGDMCCASDISTDAEEVIEILSNPVRETLGVRLVGEYGDNFELLLYDIAGRQMLSESGILRDEESLLNIGVQELPSGVYLLRIRTGDLEVVRTVSIIH